MLNKKGQSTLEYVLVLTAIIAAVIIGAKVVQQKTESSMGHVMNVTEEAVSGINATKLLQ